MEAVANDPAVDCQVHSTGGNAEATSISIVATVRNECGTIESFICSLLAQSSAPAEIIIVDGASSDGTLEILRKFEAAHGVVVISEDCNIAQGRNIGIRRSSSEIVAITDAGCEVDREWLRQIVLCFEAPERPDVVAANFKFDCRSPFEEAVVRATFSPVRESTAAAKYYPSSRSVAFRKSAWLAAGGYPEWLYAAEDTLFNIRLRQLGFRFSFCPAAVVRWRPRESWAALGRQRFNFARGNARIGVGTSSYLKNLAYHGAALLLAALSGISWWFALAAAVVLVRHAQLHLWPQAVESMRQTGRKDMLWRVLLTMEFVRIVGMIGFLRGRIDRFRDPAFISRQMSWMGVDSVDRIHLPEDAPPHDLDHRRAHHRATPSGSADSTVDLDLAIPFALLTAAAVFLIWRNVDAWAMAAPFAAAGAAMIAIMVKSLAGFSRTGPETSREIQRHYAMYTLASFLRLSAWGFAVCVAAAAWGVILYCCASAALRLPTSGIGAFVAAFVGIAICTGWQFAWHLLHIPGSIAASSSFRLSRLYPVWRALSPKRMRAVQVLVLLAITWMIFVADLRTDLIAGRVLASVLLVGAAWLSVFMQVHRTTIKRPSLATPRRTDRPNIVMIGSDTLRADRLGISKYPRDLTPYIDSLAKEGTQFTSCYVPCARTAPSLVSLFTGTWPSTHGIRDNFVSDEGIDLDTPTLAGFLGKHGYRTAAISDWSGGDLGKFPLGFQIRDLPDDQWNVKYLLRQGPKDLRLFLSLFTHNRLGKHLLPELYYLAGVPLTHLVGRDARGLIDKFAESDEPFLLNVFISTTHPPFGSEHPYYTLYSKPGYTGESKFVMARLTDPWEIIGRQGDSRTEFDLEQIIDLYDGCVRNFDDEVKKLVEHLRSRGLRENTIIVLYSDHGIELFEHDTWGQGNSVRGDFSARVPLVIVDPRIPRSSVCEHIVRSIDIMPTLLELCGVQCPYDVDGVSLEPYMSGDQPDMNLPAYNETGIWLTTIPGMAKEHLRYPSLLELLEVEDRRTGTLSIRREYRKIIVDSKDRMLRLGPWKLICQPMEWGMSYALYNVVDDPECRNDLSSAYPDVASQLEAVMNQVTGRDRMPGRTMDHGSTNVWALGGTTSAGER
jgi:arylsulfatase A-like enzyme/glycosyltransferase involved in cell wall biosynthesis